MCHLLGLRPVSGLNCKLEKKTERNSASQCRMESMLEIDSLIQGVNFIHVI